MFSSCASKPKFFDDWQSANGETEPLLTGTTWKLIEHSGGRGYTKDVVFEADGILVSYYVNGRHSKDRWQREGETVILYDSNGVSQKIGTINDNNGIKTISGTVTPNIGRMYYFSMIQRH